MTASGDIGVGGGGGKPANQLASSPAAAPSSDLAGHRHRRRLGRCRRHCSSRLVDLVHDVRLVRRGDSHGQPHHRAGSSMIRYRRRRLLRHGPAKREIRPHRCGWENLRRQLLGQGHREGRQDQRQNTQVNPDRDRTTQRQSACRCFTTTKANIGSGGRR